jgi:hypothetical protein
MHRGLGYSGTYLPAAINPKVAEDGVLRNDMETALVEAEMVMCGAAREVLERAGGLLQVPFTFMEPVTFTFCTSSQPI